MNKLNIFLLSALSSLMLACGNSKESNPAEIIENAMTDVQHPSENLTDFIAHGPDSSWKLSVQFNDKVTFTHKDKGISFQGKIESKAVAQGADVVGIMAKSDDAVLSLSIDIVQCNGNEKRVDVMHRKTASKNGTDFSGCGYYRGDPKLHDIWAVSYINQEKLNPAKFPKDIPHFEFNLKSKQLSGFAGCNQVNGNLRFEYNKMFIEPLASTKMYCADLSEIENKILNILRKGPVVYSFKDNTTLVLASTEGSITLKKVD
ncbi:MAG: META domain-containing protein [Brumimicrobium sp.]|nr:META domain-containing protein [Brumimicrobium sp.]